MKKTLSGALSLALVLALALVFCTACATAAPVTGGWQLVEHEAAELPEGAQQAFEKAVAGRSEASYLPVELLSKQIVAGTNYCILCQVTPAAKDSVPTWALVYVYADLQGSAEITNVYELYIDQHSTPAD